MERQWVKEAKNGDQEAMAKLLYDNYGIVFKYLIKFTLNKSIAEDLTQEAMVRAIEKIELYNPEKSKFSSWLITIAQNIYMDNLRKKKREQKYVEKDLLLNSLDMDPESQDGTWRCVLDALEKIGEEVRVPIILKHYYGYALEEIAKMMTIPLGTVKSRIHHGLKALRKELSKDG